MQIIVEENRVYGLPVVKNKPKHRSTGITKFYVI